MKSFPNYEEGNKTHPNTKTTSADYHGIEIEIKSNHPMTNSYNYSLEIVNPPTFHDESSQSQRAELSDIENPSPVAKGKNSAKKPRTYEP